MKAVCDLTTEEYERYRTLQANLRKKLGSNFNCYEQFKDFRRISGCAHYDFYGAVSQELIDKLGRRHTADEIIILVDDGFNHFGAACFFNGRKFSGYVNID